MLELNTEKLFYKKYDRRLQIRIRYKRGDEKIPTAEILQWLLKSKFGKDSWTGRTSTSYTGGMAFHYNVYFSDPAIYGYLSSVLNSEYLLEYEKPRDDAHKEMLATEKVITRKILFHNQYRVAIRVEPERKGWGYSSARIRNMIDWCEEQWGKESLNRDRYRINHWNNATFFFTDAKDAMLFKLANQDIKSTERVVLLSEIEETQDD